MARKGRVDFDTKAAAASIFAAIAEAQTKRLIAFAKKEIKSIGNDISVAPTKNNLDATGNLLDSLCWVVSYGGKVKDFGYYRTATASEDSHLHEYSRSIKQSVNGHFLASQFVASYTPTVTNGWEVAFAILAPYWGYWEKGHRGRSGTKQQWSVMTRHYDVIRKAIPAGKTKFHTYVAKY